MFTEKVLKFVFWNYKKYNNYINIISKLIFKISLILVFLKKISGLLLGVKSDLTDEISTSWESVLHKLLYRRGAVSTQDFLQNFQDLTLNSSLTHLSNYNGAVKTIESTFRFGQLSEVWKFGSVTIQDINNCIKYHVRCHVRW